MIWRGRHFEHHRRSSASRQARPDELAEACAKDPAFLAAPDLTENIMLRLGYRRVSPVAARLLRVRRTMVRAVVMATLISAVYAGAVLHGESDRARKPAPTTLPAALRGDLEQVGEMSRTFRTLLTPAVQIGVDHSNSPMRQAPGPSPAQRAGQSRVPWSGLL